MHVYLVLWCQSDFLNPLTIQSHIVYIVYTTTYMVYTITHECIFQKVMDGWEVLLVHIRVIPKQVKWKVG